MSDPKPASAGSNFIREIVAADVASNKHHGRVATRFPPEPNGYLHIGHAKSICLNFGLAKEFGGVTNLRFDDTNPTTESEEYAQSIREAVQWLGFQWSGEVRNASDYFEQLHAWAVQLIKQGDAYVCSLNEAEMREYRGTVTEAGRLSPFASRTVEENLDLFARMKAGEFKDGEHTLRARIDMANANMKMRDPPIYRIRHAHHYRRGNDWVIYPLYDYAHCLSDAIEEITHSICTLEFENNRELYDWLIGKVGFKMPPHQFEFARLNLTYTMMSKRKLNALVQEKKVHGWDDPRLPTILGMRRRGVTAQALKNFCEEIGVAKANSLIDVQRLEAAIRDDLEPTAQRAMAVLNPLMVVIDNYPEGQTETLEPRAMPFSRTLFIEREDFAEAPPKGWKRLALGQEIRLRHAYFIKCVEVKKDAAGEITALHCTYDPATRGGDAPDGRKVKGTLHWVSAEHAVDAKVRLYDHLFTVEQPDVVEEGKDWRDFLNPKSLTEIGSAKLEPSLANVTAGQTFQFERLGFFCADRESANGAPVFNRTVALRDNFAKKLEGSDAEVAAAKAAEGLRDAKRTEKKSPSIAVSFEDRLGKLSSDQRAQLELLEKQGVSRDDALVLSTDAASHELFGEAVAAGASAKSAARWLLSELPRVQHDGAKTIPGRELGELAAMVDAGKLSGTSAKEVLEEMVRSGKSAASIVEAKGLKQVSGADAIGPIVDEVLAKHPDEVARYKAGNKNLIGFFTGLVIKAAKGQADAKAVREVLAAKLA
jgi:glutaminyl-tRNA synthetase